MTKKLVVIGLDGLSPYFLAKLSKNSRFSNFAKLVRRGCFRILNSIPPITPTGWTSIITGVNPAVHGIWGFTKAMRIQDSVMERLYNGYDVKAPRLFEMTALHGLKSLVINFPLTYPVGSLYLRNNLVISNSLTGSRIDTYPSSLLKDYSRYFSWPGDVHKWVILEAEGVMRLAKNFNWDLLICMLDAPDKLFHRNICSVFRLTRPVREVFYVIDDLLDELMVLSDFLIMVSDHGLSTYSRWVDPLALLYRDKVLTCDYSLTEKALESAVRLVYGSVVLSAFHPLVRMLLSFRVFRAVGCREEGENETPSKVLVDKVDAEDSWLIYFRDFALRERAYHCLSAYSDLLMVYKVEELFRGPYLPGLPALMVVPGYNRGVYLSFKYSKYFRGLRFSYRPSGCHHPHGVFLAWGDGVRTSHSFKGHVLPYDVVPTVLALLGLPVPARTDGRVLPVVRGLRAKGRFDYATALRVARLKERLKRRR